MLYAGPVWAKVLEIKKNRNILKRAALTRASTAYCTVRAYRHCAHLFYSRASGRKISY